jgi:hypothetical protein
MDITTLAAKETTFVHFKSPRGEFLYTDGKPVGATVYGPATKQFATVEGRQTARALQRREDNDGKLAVASPEERRAEAAEDLADLTVSLDNLSYPPAGDAQGTTLFCAFYADQSLGHFTSQVAKAVNDWGKF